MSKLINIAIVWCSLVTIFVYLTTDIQPNKTMVIFCLAVIGFGGLVDYFKEDDK